MDDNERDKLAEEVAEKLITIFYQEVGRSIMKKMFWVLIAIMIAVGVYFGVIHIPAPGK